MRTVLCVLACGFFCAYAATAEPDELLKQFQSKKFADRLKAVETAAALKDPPREVQKAIVDACTDASPKVAQAAFAAVPKVAPKVAEHVTTLFVDKRPDNWVDAINKLADLKEDAIPATGVVAKLVTAEAVAPPPKTKGRQGINVALAGMRLFKVVGNTSPDVADSVKAVGTSPNARLEARLVAIEMLYDWSAEDEGLAKFANEGLSGTLKNGDREALRALELASKLGVRAAAVLPIVDKLKTSSDAAIRTAANDAAKKMAK